MDATRSIRFSLVATLVVAAGVSGCTNTRVARWESDLRVASVGDVADSRSSGTLEQQIVSRVNQERRRAGLPPLLRKGRLDAAAREHSRILKREMTLWGEDLGFGHHGRVSSRLDRLGYGWQACGENVAYGERRTIEHLHQGLMRSTHHRDNMLSRRFTEVGVGIVIEGPRMYLTQVFAAPAGSLK